MNLGAMLQAKLANDMFNQDTQARMQNHAAQNMAAIYGTGIQNMYPDTVSPFDPNSAPAYQMELNALCDLWSAKHGDKWVREAGDDQFWADAVTRLSAASKLEVIRGWLRLKA